VAAFGHAISGPTGDVGTDGRSVQTGRVPAGFLTVGGIPTRMQSVRQGLRSGEIEKDVYERLSCAECGEELETDNDPDEIGTVRACPECGSQWKKVG
jgi:DNA-directed RNA polymerase subunit RPC12/RpoP